MTKLIEYLCIAYLTGSCFTALAIFLGLRAIAGAIIRSRPEHLLPIKAIIEKSKAGDEFKIRID